MCFFVNNEIKKTPTRGGTAYKKLCSGFSVNRSDESHYDFQK